MIIVIQFHGLFSPLFFWTDYIIIIVLRQTLRTTSKNKDTIHLTALEAGDFSYFMLNKGLFKLLTVILYIFKNSVGRNAVVRTRYVSAQSNQSL